MFNPLYIRLCCISKQTCIESVCFNVVYRWFICIIFAIENQGIKWGMKYVLYVILLCKCHLYSFRWIVRTNVFYINLHRGLTRTHHASVYQSPSIEVIRKQFRSFECLMWTYVSNQSNIFWSHLINCTDTRSSNMLNWNEEAFLCTIYSIGKGTRVCYVTPLVHSIWNDATKQYFMESHNWREKRSIPSCIVFFF